ncbi:MAG: hypothetical protein JRG91_13620 [Deltaproteobacteria bacterium]|nr:hypothetical protein [Deltaproteobacteria bacterium]
MRAATIALCLVSLFLLAACEKKEPCEKPYSCPNVDYINCMPPVPSGTDECIGECHDWIRDNCPDVEYAY